MSSRPWNSVSCCVAAVVVAPTRDVVEEGVQSLESVSIAGVVWTLESFVVAVVVVVASVGGVCGA